MEKIHSYQHLSDRKSHSCRRRAFLRETGKFIEKCKYQYAESVKEFQKDTRSSLETLAEDNRESFQDSRIDFSKNIYPQLDQSLEGLANREGSVNNNITQHNIHDKTDERSAGSIKICIAQQLQSIYTDGQCHGTGGSETAENCHGSADTANSDMYQNILSLEKIDVKDILNFMSSPSEHKDGCPV